jgi:archaellin
MGIGALIIFIAMTLVAAIAATVLITTSSVLESKALNVGNEARERLTTNVEIVSIVAEDGSLNSDLNETFVTVRLSAGSPSIDMETTTLELSTNDITRTYNYTATNFAVPRDPPTDNTTICPSFNVTVEAGDSDAILELGELFRLNLCHYSRPFVEDEEIRIVIQPQNGGRVLKIVRTPNVILNTREYLYP